MPEPGMYTIVTFAKRGDPIVVIDDVNYIVKGAPTGVRPQTEIPIGRFRTSGGRKPVHFADFGLQYLQSGEAASASVAEQPGPLDRMVEDHE